MSEYITENPEHWQAVRELFLKASDRDLEARASLFAEAAAKNPDIARDAAMLLAAGESVTTEFEDGPAGLGLEIDRGPTPDHIGRYRVLEVLGDGRAGIVYRAKQENPDREVAVKLLRAAIWSHASVQRFRNEVKVLSLLRHEHIARIYDAGALPEPGGAARPYFVMELVEGKSISEFVAGSPMDQRQIIELFLQMCDAVEHAHKQGIIHRDLKPANVLVESKVNSEGRPDSSPKVKVIDFGISRILGSEERSTLTGQVLGTPGYMSPEQRQGRSQLIDTRSDVYAAGAILRELLSSRKFGGKPDTRSLASDLKVILETAIALDVERRYQSLSSFSGDLRRFLVNRPIEARPPTLLYPVSKFVRRNRTLTAAITLAAVACVGMLIVQSFARHRAEQATERIRDLAGVLLNAVTPMYEGKIGKAAERKALLLKLAPLIEANAESFPLDDVSQSDYATLLGWLGDVMEEEARWEEAFQFLRRALAIREALASKSPNDPKVLAAHSVAMVRVGDVSDKAKARDPGELWYMSALMLDMQINDRWPSNPTLLSNLAFSYERMASFCLERDKFAEAAHYSDSELTTARRLLKSQPDSTLAIWGVSSALGVKASILEKRRMDAERLVIGLEEIGFLRRLQQISPDTKQTQKRLVNCLIAASDVQSAVHPELKQSSADMMREAVSIAGHLTRSDPTEVDARLLYIRALCVLSSALTRVHDEAGANLAMENALSAAGDFVEQSGHSHEAVMAQVRALHYAVRIAIENRDDNAVSSRGRAMLPRARSVDAANPSVESKRLLCRVLLDLPDASIAECDEAVALARWVVTRASQDRFLKYMANASRDRIVNNLTLAESLTCAGEQSEADRVMTELLGSIPQEETALLRELKAEQEKWAVKKSVRASKQ